MTLIPTKASIQYSEQAINNVIMLKQFVKSIPPIFEALATAKSELLTKISSVGFTLLLSSTGAESIKLCAPEEVEDVRKLIDETINEDITYQHQPLDLRNQRTYAVKASKLGHSGSSLADISILVWCKWSS